ncbi:MAG TPA: hypothetical protein VFF14_09710 [Candidatus Deferrimicrobium sp.]|nr:hypothetical protein [Candidatus Deferrimicrobium sp.]
MTVSGIRELLIKWWYGGNFRSRAKDDYRKVSKLNLGITELFPEEEDVLFAQIDRENF